MNNYKVSKDLKKIMELTHYDIGAVEIEGLGKIYFNDIKFKGNVNKEKMVKYADKLGIKLDEDSLSIINLEDICIYVFIEIANKVGSLFPSGKMIYYILNCIAEEVENIYKEIVKKYNRYNQDKIEFIEEIFKVDTYVDKGWNSDRLNIYLVNGIFDIYKKD